MKNLFESINFENLHEKDFNIVTTKNKSLVTFATEFLESNELLENFNYYSKLALINALNAKLEKDLLKFGIVESYTEKLDSMDFEINFLLNTKKNQTVHIAVGLNSSGKKFECFVDPKSNNTEDDEDNDGFVRFAASTTYEILFKKLTKELKTL